MKLVEYFLIVDRWGKVFFSINISLLGPGDIDIITSDFSGSVLLLFMLL